MSEAGYWCSEAGYWCNRRVEWARLWVVTYVLPGTGAWTWVTFIDPESKQAANGEDAQSAKGTAT